MLNTEHMNNFIGTSRPQIWSEIFPKTTKNLKYNYGNFPNESLGQEKHFKHVFGVGVG